MTAIEKYDEQRGIKFSTFAYYWIKQQMYEYIHDSSSIVKISPYIKKKNKDDGKSISSTSLDNQDMPLYNLLSLRSSENIILLKHDFEKLIKILSQLDPYEEKLIRLRFGIFN